MFKKLFTLTVCLYSSNLIAAEITVSAAASLTNAFKDIAHQYEAEYQDAKINLNFAGSGTLLQQIDKGAPVDVFASADEKTMDMAIEKGYIQKDAQQIFAKNSLVIITPKNSKIQISSLSDLLKSQYQKIALSNTKNVPVGRYSKAVLEENKLWEKIEPKLIITQHVRQSLDYVARSEVNLGFVYSTDAAIMKDKVSIVYRVPVTQEIKYPIAVLKNSKQQAEAKRFSQYIQGEKAQKILSQYGFIVN